MASPRPSYPLRTKVIVIGVLAVAAVAFTLAIITADTGNDDAATISGLPGQSSNADGVEGFVPANGAEILSQQSIGIDLASGWTAELAILPNDGAAIPIPQDQINPTSLNELIFVPGPGKVVESLPTGPTCMRAVLWSLVDGRPATERTEQWCFDVT